MNRRTRIAAIAVIIALLGGLALALRGQTKPPIAKNPTPSPAPPVALPAAAAMAGTPAFAGEGGGTISLKEIARKAAQEAECALIQRMLTCTCWNRKEAAEILGISYKALLYKIKENGLDKA